MRVEMEAWRLVRFPRKRELTWTRELQGSRARMGLKEDGGSTPAPKIGQPYSNHNASTALQRHTSPLGNYCTQTAFDDTLNDAPWYPCVTGNSIDSSRLLGLTCSRFDQDASNIDICSVCRATLVERSCEHTPHHMEDVHHHTAALLIAKERTPIHQPS